MKNKSIKRRYYTEIFDVMDSQFKDEIYSWVCECKTVTIAKNIARMLNAEYERTNRAVHH